MQCYNNTVRGRTNKIDWLEGERMEKKLRNKKRSFFISEKTYMILLAVLIGAATGFGAIGFRLLISFFHGFFFSGGEEVLAFMGRYYVVLVPAAGGLLVGPLVYFFAREAKGHGVPEVMAAIAAKGGIIRPRIVVVKSLASAITIGSGGSVGREGPIVQIGSAIGSVFGQVLNMSSEKIKLLVGCGAAGGIAATFNAPIGGALFAVEIILGQFSTNNFVLIVISSVTSSLVGRIFLGNTPAFVVPDYTLNNPEELLFYAVLGVICGLFAFLYIKVLYKFEDLADSVKGIPEYFKPVLGGFLVGTIGLTFPQIFGVGYETMEAAFRGEILFGTLLALAFIKLIATSITIASGGSGGVFAPGLFMGAMLGGAFGFIIHNLFPEVAITPEAYALIGMGGIFAGTAQAPLTAIIMLFELTDGYSLILPIMMVCVLSPFIVNSLYKENIYTVKLRRRGLEIHANRINDQMQIVKVADAMVRDVISFAEDTKIEHCYQEISSLKGNSSFPIVDAKGYLRGIVSKREIIEAVKNGRGQEKIEGIMNPNPVTILPLQSIGEAAYKMAIFDVRSLPVVEKDGEGLKLVGIIARSDVIVSYTSAFENGQS